MPLEFYPWMHLAGRVLFSLIFIVIGLTHLLKLRDMTAYARSKGVPAPALATVASGLVILFGAICIVLGWHRFIGAGLLVIFLLPTAFVMHAFWKEKDPGARMNEMTHFLKDLALAGAALYMAVYAGPGWPFTVVG